MRPELSGWLIFLAFLPEAMLISNLEPRGENVCLVEESFQVTVDVPETYEEGYKDYQWCLRLPPRCTVYKWRLVTRIVQKEVTNTRQVPQCCRGYTPSGEICVPHCQQPCRHGTCSLPDSCTCFPGFWGPLCQEICTRGTWGKNCSQSCECQNDAFCNSMTGSCLCSPGWRGVRCQEPCTEGFFGLECRRPCDCKGLCHHITGECLIPTTSTTEPTSTSEIISTDASTTEETSISEYKYKTTTVQTTQTQESVPTNPGVTLSTQEPAKNSFSTETQFQTQFNLEVASTETNTWSVSMTTAQETSFEDTTFIKTTAEPSCSDEFSSSTPITEPNTDLSVNNNLKSTSPSPFLEISPEQTSPSQKTTNVVSWSSTPSTVLTTNSPEAETTGIILTQSVDNLTTVTPSLEERQKGPRELAGLAVTIALSVVGSLILLFAAAGVALARHRKAPPTVQSEPPTDTGLYRFYAEEPLPVKSVFLNPTYGCGDFDIVPEQPNLHTFKAAEDSFEAELREILESQYDHPPLPISSSSSHLDHLYDEIDSALDTRTDYTKYF